MYLGIDIGGTNIKIGTFEKPDQLLTTATIPVTQDFQRSIQKITAQAKKLSAPKAIGGVGICIAGPDIDREKGIIKRAVNLPGWSNQPIKKILEHNLNTKVVLAHDVVCAALGEATIGHGQNLNSFIFLIWGTGFGGATVERFREKLKITQIEPGHQIIEMDGKKCTCGQNGCLEAYIGGWALEKLYGRDLSQIKEEKIWDGIAQKSAQGILNINLISPTKVIIFGGGVISKQSHLLVRIAKRLKNTQKVFTPPTLTLSKKGEDISLYGCVNLLFAPKEGLDIR